VKGFLWRMAGSFVLATLGLAMTFWALERTSLIAFAGAGGEGPSRPPAQVYLLLFAGLIVLNLSTFYALVKWSRYLRENPDAKQAPVPLLISIMVIAGGLLVGGMAVHAGWVKSQNPVPTEVSQGFIAYEVSFAMLVIVPLVLVAVRWSPGYKTRPIDF